MPQKKSTESSTAFKNWINADLIKRMAAHISYHYSSFDVNHYSKISSQLKKLELKDRVQLISRTLAECLPSDFSKAAEILTLAVTKPHPKTNPLKGFDLWPFTDFIQTQGLDHFDESMAALYEVTQRFTAEFAVRPFFNHQPKKTLQLFQKWSTDSNVHIRRLVSEGSRPRLPWGEQLKNFIRDPEPTIKLLDKLKYDEELYVRKSVANHLNDISKDHPDLAIATAQRWLRQAPTKHKEKINWIVRHALRTLLKKGHPEALDLLGFPSKAKVKLQELKLRNRNVSIGSSLEFSFSLQASEPTRIMIDYLIHHKKSNGENKAKVFKLTTKDLAAKEVIEVTKKHSFKVVTTRVYYPGTHYLEIMINGTLKAKVPFELKN